MHKLKTMVNLKPGAGTGSPEEVKDLTERVDILEKRTRSRIWCQKIIKFNKCNFRTNWRFCWFNS